MKYLEWEYKQANEMEWEDEEKSVTTFKIDEPIKNHYNGKKHWKDSNKF